MRIQCEPCVRLGAASGELPGYGHLCRAVREDACTLKMHVALECPPRQVLIPLPVAIARGPMLTALECPPRQVVYASMLDVGTSPRRNGRPVPHMALPSGQGPEVIRPRARLARWRAPPLLARGRSSSLPWPRPLDTHCPHVWRAHDSRPGTFAPRLDALGIKLSGGDDVVSMGRPVGCGAAAGFTPPSAAAVAALPASGAAAAMAAAAAAAADASAQGQPVAVVADPARALAQAVAAVAADVGALEGMGGAGAAAGGGGGNGGGGGGAAGGRLAPHLSVERPRVFHLSLTHDELELAAPRFHVEPPSCAARALGRGVTATGGVMHATRPQLLQVACACADGPRMANVTVTLTLHEHTSPVWSYAQRCGAAAAGAAAGAGAAQAVGLPA